MKRLKSIGLSILAIFALGTVLAASASAEAGFLLESGGHPTLATILGGPITLETTAHKVTCEKLDETHIEFETDKHAKGTLKLLGCKAEGLFAVNSLGNNSGEIIVPVLFLFCLDPTTSTPKLLSEYGVAAEVSGVHLEVPAVGTLLELNGRVIASILAREGRLFLVDFVGSKGVQEVAKCVEGKSEKAHNFTSSTNHGTPETTSENVSKGLLQFDQEGVTLEDA